MVESKGFIHEDHTSETVDALARLKADPRVTAFTKSGEVLTSLSGAQVANQSIMRLEIFGHGNRNMAGPYLRETIAYFAAKWKPYLASGCKVFLNSCNVGPCGRTDCIAQELASCLGQDAFVYGGKGYMNACTMHDGSTCQVRAKPNLTLSNEDGSASVTFDAVTTCSDYSQPGEGAFELFRPLPLVNYIAPKRSYATYAEFIQATPKYPGLKLLHAAAKIALTKPSINSNDGIATDITYRDGSGHLIEVLGEGKAIRVGTRLYPLKFPSGYSQVQSDLRELSTPLYDPQSYPLVKQVDASGFSVSSPDFPELPPSSAHQEDQAVSMHLAKIRDRQLALVREGRALPYPGLNEHQDPP